MVITRFGRVEFDPMSVPLAAPMSRKDSGAFARRLDAETPARPATPAPKRTEQDVPAPVAADPEAPPPDAEPTPVATDDQTPETGNGATPAPVPVQTTEPLSGGAPARLNAAGKGAGAPLEASDPAPKVQAAKAQPVLAAQPARTDVQVTVAVPATVAAPEAAPTARNDKALHDTVATANRTSLPKAAATGYRTLTPQALQLDEQARDSVFKQILFRLGKDRGEMRLRLDPPELGELDLHLVVEKGSKLRLLVVTERQELRDLLQGGLSDLRQKLQEGGLSVTHADVQTRQEAADRGTYDRGDDGWHRDTNGTDTDAPVAVARAKNTGWFTAQGLDFWV